MAYELLGLTLAYIYIYFAWNNITPKLYMVKISNITERMLTSMILMQGYLGSSILYHSEDIL